MQKSIALSMNPLNAGFSNRFWAMATFLTVFILFIFSIIQVNTYTGELYSIKSYENRIQDLNEENRALEINFTKADSLKNLGSYVQNQTFEKISSIKYIRVLGSTALAK